MSIQDKSTAWLLNKLKSKEMVLKTILTDTIGNNSLDNQFTQTRLKQEIEILKFLIDITTE